MELLRRLHDAKVNSKPKYDRIIVIGHSLGSAIGYDIMKFYWVDVHEQLLIKSNSDAARKLKDLIKAGKAVSADSQGNNCNSYQEAQEALIRALPLDSPWRITDFITLGSPLTYGDFVLARSEEELELRQRQRELPTCPPQEDEDTRGYSFPVENKNGEVIGEVLHHAAYFALTRWTNLYFPGDLIGGEVGRLFGSGVLDLECDFPLIRTDPVGSDHTLNTGLEITRIRCQQAWTS